MFIKQVILCLVILPIIFIHGQIQKTASNQASCYDSDNSPDPNPLWNQAGLDMNIDWVIRCREIVAYKILWSNAIGWSDWFVTGVNDLLPANGGNQKRMWSLFTQHYHTTISCRSDVYKLNGTKC